MANKQIEIHNNTWQATEHDVATRIKGSAFKSLKSLFSGTKLGVEVGTQAYVFSNKKLLDIKKAGEHQLDGKADEVVIVRETPMPLSFIFDELLSKEYLPLSMALSIRVRVNDMALFISNCLGSSNNTVMTDADIAERLSANMRQILSEQLATLEIRTIADTEQMRPRLTRALEDGMQQLLSRCGLCIVGMDELYIFQSQYDENNTIIAQSWLECDKKEKALRAKQSLQALENEEAQAEIEHLRHSQQIKYLLHKLAHEEKESDYTNLLRDIDLFERVGKAQNRAEAIQLGLEEEADKLTHQVRQQQQLRDEEALDWQQVRELARKEREQALRVAEEMNRHTLKMLVIKNNHGEQQQVLQAEIELAKLGDDKEMQTLVASLEREKIKAEHNRGEEIKNAEAKLHIEETIFNQRISQAIRTDSKDLDNWERFLNINEDKRDRRAQRERDKAEQAHKHELEKLDKIGQLPSEALIYLSDKEKGEVIAGLSKAKSLQGFSEAEILAMTANNDPQIVDALKERFATEGQNSITATEKAFYQRVLDMSADSIRDIKEQSAKHSSDLMESQRILSHTAIEMARAASGQVNQVFEKKSKKSKKSKRD